MTDNKVYVDQNGTEIVQVNRADGLGVSEIKKLGIEQIIISTEKNPVVAFRAKKLQLPVSYGVKNKVQELMKFSKNENIDLDNMAFVGNDINDADCMKIVGFPVAVADSVENIKTISKLILEKKGGDGAVRELCELIFKAHQNA